jgi:hypothetical protein
MIPGHVYVSNLLTTAAYRGVEGCVIECGVWRGGMIAGIAEILGRDRDYYLFDSFEGLPAPTAVDGDSAFTCALNAGNAASHYNCKAEATFAQKAMQMAKARNVHIVQGWFKDTIPSFVPPTKIALLRLDGDWFESTWVALNHFYKYMAADGIIILDDYYNWEGCAKAVHKFIADNELPARIDRSFGFTCILRLYQGEGWLPDRHPHRRWFG